MNNLTVGEPVKKAFVATKEFLKSKDAQLIGKTHTNFGFGVSFKVSDLLKMTISWFLLSLKAFSLTI